MTAIGGALLTWLVCADTWLRLTVHAEPTAVALLGLVVAVAALVLAAVVTMRRALRVAKRVRSRMPAPRRRYEAASPPLTRGRRPVGAQGARSPGAETALLVSRAI
jgi:hypothetical protein